MKRSDRKLDQSSNSIKRHTTSPIRVSRHNYPTMQQRTAQNNVSPTTRYRQQSYAEVHNVKQRIKIPPNHYQSHNSPYTPSTPIISNATSPIHLAAVVGKNERLYFEEYDEYVTTILRSNSSEANNTINNIQARTLEFRRLPAAQKEAMLKEVEDILELESSESTYDNIHTSVVDLVEPIPESTTKPMLGTARDSVTKENSKSSIEIAKTNYISPTKASTILPTLDINFDKFRKFSKYNKMNRNAQTAVKNKKKENQFDDGTNEEIGNNENNEKDIHKAFEEDDNDNNDGLVDVLNYFRSPIQENDVVQKKLTTRPISNFKARWRKTLMTSPSSTSSSSHNTETTTSSNITTTTTSTDNTATTTSSPLSKLTNPRSPDDTPSNKVLDYFHSPIVLTTSATEEDEDKLENTSSYSSSHE